MVNKLKCNVGNYQCGGKCQPNTNNCPNDNLQRVTPLANRFESIINKLSGDINKDQKPNEDIKKRINSELDKLSKSLSKGDEKESKNINKEINKIIDEFKNKNTPDDAVTKEIKTKVSEQVDEIFNQIKEKFSPTKEKVESAPEKLKPIIENARSRMNNYSEEDNQDIAKRFKGNEINEDALPMLSAYARSDYRVINDTLRGKRPQKIDFVPGKGIQDIDYSDEEMRVVQEKIEAMEYSYNQLKPLEEDTELYRGTDLPPEILDNLKEGGEWKDDGYSSSSTNKEVSKRFAKNVFFVYKAKKGTENIKDLGKINQLGEEERLIRPGTKFKINRIEEQNGIKVVYLEE